jgi:hypothetical protein
MIKPISHLLSLSLVKRFEPLAEALGVSEVARSERGFLTAYKEAGGDWNALDPWWQNRRNNFVKRHMAQVEIRNEPLFSDDGMPTRRHLGLIMWAHSPLTEKQLEKVMPRHNPERAAPSKPRFFVHLSLDCEDGEWSIYNDTDEYIQHEYGEEYNSAGHVFDRSLAAKQLFGNEHQFSSSSLDEINHVLSDLAEGLEAEDFRYPVVLTNEHSGERPFFLYDGKGGNALRNNPEWAKKLGGWMGRGEKRARTTTARAGRAAWEGTKSGAKRAGRAAWEGTKSGAKRAGRAAWEGTKSGAKRAASATSDYAKEVGRDFAGSYKNSRKNPHDAGPRILTTYATTTPESIEQGDYADHGWEDEIGQSMLPDQYDREEGLTAADLAVDYLQSEGAIHPSSSHPSRGMWYTTSPQINEWGESIEYSFHLRGFTPEEEMEIAERMLR